MPGESEQAEKDALARARAERSRTQVLFGVYRGLTYEEQARIDAYAQDEAARQVEGNGFAPDDPFVGEFLARVAQRRNWLWGKCVAEWYPERVVAVMRDQRVSISAGQWPEAVLRAAGAFQRPERERYRDAPERESA